MINELYMLSNAIKNAKINTKTWHSDYKPLPKASDNAPCIQIILSKQNVKELRRVSDEKVKELRKYGNNQGTYPAMNIVPLYRIVDPKAKEILTNLRTRKSTEFNIDQIREWCSIDNNNWNKKFRKKYNNCILEKTKELSEKLKDYNEHPIHQLIYQTDCFIDPNKLHNQLEKQAFAMLEQKIDIPIAIYLLFHLGDSSKKAEDDSGTLSIIFDSQELYEASYSTITDTFTDYLNDTLLKIEDDEYNSQKQESVDAFGNNFFDDPTHDKPMPAVKLEGGFDVILRTMFDQQPSQYRYGVIGNETYPCSPQLRKELKGALEWISCKENEEKTWTKLNKDEILFVFPFRQPEIDTSYTNAFSGWGNDKSQKSKTFEVSAEKFISSLKENKNSDTIDITNRIQFFIIRKIDKGRTKIVYTYNTTPQEIEEKSKEWSKGCANLPSMNIGRFRTLFPMSITEIMNMVLKSDGEPANSNDKFNRYCSYHGMELFFGTEELVKHDLITLINNIEPVAPSLINIIQSTDTNDKKKQKQRYKFKQSIVLLGLLLYMLGVKKEDYMNEYPYLYGQLLKVSDELHELYCRAVRGDNQIPNQLIGSSMYNAAVNMPSKTLAQLGLRMNYYLNWAKSYRYKDEIDERKESWRAGWYLRIYEQIATKLSHMLENRGRFSDDERALMFIGYLADFPKTKNSKELERGINDEQ